MSDDPLNMQITIAPDSAGGRHCGGCTLCCKLVPVEILHKVAGERCRFQSHKGCKVYRTPRFPEECGLWSCRWLVDPDASGLRRPDRSHYVVDVMPDFIGVSDNASGAVESVAVMQVWCDPEHPDAWRDPALRRYIEHVAQAQRAATIIRFGSRRAIVVFAPCLTDDGAWHERESEAAPTGSGWQNPLDPLRARSRAMREALARDA